jgi:hypothetical protein
MTNLSGSFRQKLPNHVQRMMDGEIVNISANQLVLNTSVCVKKAIILVQTVTHAFSLQRNVSASMESVEGAGCVSALLDGRERNVM